MAVMVEKMRTSPGPVYVYSQYRTLAGIAPFALALRAHGYIEYGWGDPLIKPCPQVPMDHTRDAVTGKTWKESTEKQRSSFQPLTYMFWPRSTVKSDKKNHLLNRFNADNNKLGHVIRVFLSTKSGAEGLNLMNVRQVHIMEPYWTRCVSSKQWAGQSDSVHTLPCQKLVEKSMLTSTMPRSIPIRQERTSTRTVRTRPLINTWQLLPLRNNT